MRSHTLDDAGADAFWTVGAGHIERLPASRSEARQAGGFLQVRKSDGNRIPSLSPFSCAGGADRIRSWHGLGGARCDHQQPLMGMNGELLPRKKRNETLMTDDYWENHEHPSPMEMMTDELAESMRKYVAAELKRGKEPTLFIRLLRDVLQEWDARPRVLH
jgi:hypothetical protein